MKVLVVTTSFPQISNPNSGFFVQQLVLNFSSKIEVTVISPADRHRAGVFKENNYKRVNFSYAPSPWRVLAHAPGGLAELSGRKILAVVLLPVLVAVEFCVVLKWARRNDIIHANWSINGIIAGIAGKLLFRPVITTLRGSDVNKAEGSFLYSVLIRICFRLSSRIATVSEPLRNKIALLFPEYKRNIIVVENGVEDEFLAIDRSGSQDDSEYKILSIGNLTKNKSVDTILWAIHGMSSNSIRLDIIGDGPERELLERLSASLGLEKIVIFHGAVDASDRITFFKKADIFAFSSISEGRPNVILEAMASGLALVSSDIDGVRDLVADGENGLLFKTGDACDLSMKLEELIQNASLRRTLGSNAKRFVINKGLTWKNGARQYEQIYRSIIEQGGRN